MLSEKDRRTLLGLYGATTLEIVEAMKSVLRAWHVNMQRAQAIDALLHRAHRLRDDSSTVDLRSTVDLLRGFAALLHAVQDGEVAPTHDTSLLLEDVIDRIAEVAAAALEGEWEQPDAHEDLIARLAAQRLKRAS